MKRWLWLSLTMLLLLTGCAAGARDEETFLRWQTALREAETISFSADVDAHTGQEAFSYSAECQCRVEETVVTLTGPDTVAGTVFRSGDGGNTLEYDGAILYLGPGGDGGGTEPCRLLPLLAEAAVRGRVIHTGREGGLLAVALEVTEDWTVTLRLEGEELALREAELAYQGRTAGTAVIRSWETMKEAA